ncbi:hypothetical protein GC170_11575 [bacterium]|nr:hypothetical protein [bacterium]
MNDRKTVIGSLMTGSDDAATRDRRERCRVLPGIERHEDRVVLSHMGMPGGFGGGFQGGQAAAVSSCDMQGGMMGRGGPGGMMMGRGQFGPMRGPGGMQSGDSTTRPALPAGAQVMASLNEAGVAGGFGYAHGGPIGPDGSTPTSSDPATQALLDNLTAALDKQRTDAQAIAANSNLTIAAMNGLHQAVDGLQADGLTLDKTATDAAVSSLVRAVAGQTDTTEAKTAFSALFANSGVSQEAIDSAISAITRVVTESNQTVANLDTLKADKDAVDAAFQAMKDSGYVPPQPDGQFGQSYHGDRQTRGMGMNDSGSGTTTSTDSATVSSTGTGTADNSSSAGTTRRGPGAGFGRAGRFSTRGFAGRRGFGSRF